MLDMGADSPILAVVADGQLKAINSSCTAASVFSKPNEHEALETM
jgi:hypothetical protein